MGYVIIVDKTSMRCVDCSCILKFGHSNVCPSKKGMPGYQRLTRMGFKSLPVLSLR